MSTLTWAALCALTVYALAMLWRRYGRSRRGRLWRKLYRRERARADRSRKEAERLREDARLRLDDRQRLYHSLMHPQDETRWPSCS